MSRHRMTLVGRAEAKRMFPRFWKIDKVLRRRSKGGERLSGVMGRKERKPVDGCLEIEAALRFVWSCITSSSNTYCNLLYAL